MTATELVGRLAGPVFLPGDVGFDAEIAAWNLATVHRPVVAIGATTTADVAAAVRWAAEHGLPVAVQATGHGAVAPATGCVLVTTHRMDEVTVDPATNTVRVGAGVKWARVIEAAAPYGLAPLSGSSSDVGAVSYTLGGGIGLMARRYGYAADHVRSLQIVTADGSIHDVDADHHAALFWAVRGGKGNFGIVTSIEIALMPISTLYAGGIFYPGAVATDVLHAYRTWTSTLPEETTTSVAILRLPPLPEVPEPLRGQTVVHLRFIHSGDADEGARLLAPMRAVAPAVIDYVDKMPFTAVDAIHQDPTDPMPGWERGAMLADLTPEVVDAILAAAGPQVELPLVMVELRHLGGALSRQADVPNAVPGRGAGFSFFVLGPLFPGLEGIVPAVGGAVLDAVTPFITPGTPLNFAGKATPDQLLAAWAPEDRERLLQIKEEYDPANMFRFGQAFVA
ncbi:FAD-binding oxidoreductase [Planosporangium flavigriseum]|nr:FAD-binding oxidoreductase [Planosporangium flavigriseum]